MFELVFMINTAQDATKMFAVDAREPLTRCLTLHATSGQGLQYFSLHNA